MNLLSPEFRERLKRLRFAVERVRADRSRGNRLSHTKGAGMEFAGHRPYTPGDDTRYLDWNAHARLDQLVLKQYESPGEMTLVLALDCAASMNYGTPNKFDAAKQLAAALGYIALNASDRVLLAPLRRKRERAASLSGPAMSDEMLQRLQGLRTSMGINQARKWLNNLGRVPGESTAVLLTDFQARETLLQSVRELRRMHARVLVIHLLAPQELDPALEGRTRMHLLGPDGACGQVTLQMDEALLARYRKELANWRHALATACRRLGATLFEVGSNESMEDLVLEMVGAGYVRVGRAG